MMSCVQGLFQLRYWNMKMLPKRGWMKGNTHLTWCLHFHNDCKINIKQDSPGKLYLCVITEIVT